MQLEDTARLIEAIAKLVGDRANAARINACMKQLGIVGSVARLINAGTTEERASVAACLSIER